MAVASSGEIYAHRDNGREVKAGGKRPSYLAMSAADHGCNPSRPDSEHTRGHPLVIGFGPGVTGM